jgi:hypothetical protein
MMKRLSAAAAVAAFAVVGLGLTLSASNGGDNFKHTNYLTFSGPVGLPGVTLGAGTYVFELADPHMSADVVRVMNQARSQVYFTAFTERVDRPWDLPRDRVVTLGEAARGAAPPITAWYPRDEGFGYKFKYQ